MENMVSYANSNYSNYTTRTRPFLVSEALHI